MLIFLLFLLYRTSVQRVRTAAALQLPVCAHRIRQPPSTNPKQPTHPKLDLTQPSTTEQSGNLLNMLMCQASSATKSPAATWLRLQSGLNGEWVECGGCQGVDQGLGMCSFRTCSIQNGRLAVHSRIEFRSISSGRRGEGWWYSARLTPKVNFAFFAVGRCLCCISFFFALPCLVFLLCCCFYLILLPLL